MPKPTARRRLAGDAGDDAIQRLLLRGERLGQHIGPGAEAALQAAVRLGVLRAGVALPQPGALLLAHAGHRSARRRLHQRLVAFVQLIVQQTECGHCADAIFYRRTGLFAVERRRPCTAGAQHQSAAKQQSHHARAMVHCTASWRAGSSDNNSKVTASAT
jgi:hypothetical protein